ncbi:MAG TPA: hypothetical protein VK674_04160 [Candidatus Limnocylindria bacterium]|nr:hypothetical protein [Candidatus Limnocylindria bacterium]
MTTETPRTHVLIVDDEDAHLIGGPADWLCRPFEKLQLPVERVGNTVALQDLADSGRLSTVGLVALDGSFPYQQGDSPSSQEWPIALGILCRDNPIPPIAITPITGNADIYQSMVSATAQRGLWLLAPEAGTPGVIPGDKRSMLVWAAGAFAALQDQRPPG